ncbi:MAG: SPASM domain-containing protein [Methylovulum sp.]|nr:SPASM domain-containing protein [Methylovulum sp.]MCF7997780.1 SPASM domain-containing protein [Methylovulum sp.]MCF8494739.1 SPASM domain-containing protein [Rickettsiaceae bacterium]
MKAAIKPRINMKERTKLEEVIPLDTPFILTVSPASACNLKCAFCPTGDRHLMRSTDRFMGLMEYSLFTKIIDDLEYFPQKIKVLMLVNDGEPFLNKNLDSMVRYAKRSNNVPFIETTTNGILMTSDRVGGLIDAGIDKINISIYGMDSATYKDFAKSDVDFDIILANIKWLYENKGNTEIVIKIPKELLATNATVENFYEMFGDYCDRVFVENSSQMWPDFDVSKRMNVDFTEGLWGHQIEEKLVCPNIFYALTINANGEVSACYVDWARALLVGDVKVQNLNEIWNSKEFNNLRIQHLSGNRNKNLVCKKCNQPQHCSLDNLDPYKDELLTKLVNKI